MWTKQSITIYIIRTKLTTLHTTPRKYIYEYSRMIEEKSKHFHLYIGLYDVGAKSHIYT